MGDAIDFPKNYDIYLIKAVRNLQKGNLLEAERYVEQAYALKKGKTANILYSSILAERGNFEEAKEIADENFGLYEKTEEKQLFYLTLLLHLRMFLQADTFLKKWRKNASRENAEKWEKMEETLAKEKEKMKREEKEKQKQVTQKLGNLSAFPPEEQVRILQESEIVPESVFQQLASSLLIHPYVFQASKTILLHDLLSRKAASSFSLLWFNEVKEVRPSLLLPLTEQPIYKAVHRVLENVTEKNPTLQAMIEMEMDRHLFELYPFAEEVILFPEEWVGYYLALYDESSHQVIKQERSHQRMKEWFDRLVGEDLNNDFQ